MNYFQAAQHGPKTPKQIREHQRYDELEDTMNRRLLGLAELRKKFAQGGQRK